MDRIEFLFDYPQYFNLVNRWRFSEWGHLKKDTNEEEFLVKLKLKSLKNRVPSVYIYLKDDKPVGTAALVEYDMATRKELSPWLAGVYIVPEMRRKGIGSKLVKYVMKEARRIGIGKLYLFTPDMSHFYRKIDWTLKEKVFYSGMDVDIMEIGLNRDRFY